jgi:hypothetical protein
VQEFPESFLYRLPLRQIGYFSQSMTNWQVVMLWERTLGNESKKPPSIQYYIFKRRNRLRRMMITNEMYEQRKKSWFSNGDSKIWSVFSSLIDFHLQICFYLIFLHF